MNFFPSRHRHCPQCSQRTIMVKGQKLVEYYHRGVVCHFIGSALAVPLDEEMIRPGEGEVVAARRLLERVVRTYGRFFQAVVVDGLYLEAPFINFCQEHGKHVIAVLKGQHRVLLQDAQGLFSQMAPQVWQEPRRTVMLWEEEGFESCEGISTPLRVLYAQEIENKRSGVAGKWIHTQETHHWLWATTIPASLMHARQLWEAAHRRWDIENDLFNTLSTHFSLDHCFRHHPTAILNFILTLFIAYVLLQSFYHRNLKPQRRAGFTLIGVASQLYLGLAEYGLSAPWSQYPRAPPL
ncbi:MAG: transposase [Deltaproteobacteria bacterium]|nr:transposase [Deltaproteobacteria bacterium]